MTGKALTPRAFTLTRQLLLLAIITAVGAGCAGQREQELAASSAITFSAPGFYLEPGSTLTWRSDMVYLFDDPRERPENFKPFVQQEIQAYLEAKGYRFVAAGAPSTYGLVAVVVLGEDMTATEVLNQFRLTPSFNASRRYEEGTLVVALYDTANEKVLWRGALQSNVDLEMPPEQRRLLVREHVKRLLKNLPTSPPD